MSPIFGGRAGGIGLILCLVSLSGAEVPKQESIEVDARELTIEGRAWPGEGPTYGRLPRRIQGEIRPELWQMAQYASGLSVRFIANGTGIGVLWDQLSTEENSVNLSGIVRSGMDLYVREGEVWHWIGQAFPRPDMKQAQILVEGVSRKYRQYRLSPAGANRDGREPSDHRRSIPGKTRPCMMRSDA